MALDRSETFDDIDKPEPVVDWAAIDGRDAPLLETGEALDPERERVDMAELYPDRFTAASADRQAHLEAAYADDQRADTLAREINPGYYSDDPGERAGRQTNCADCARAFQDGIDGRPRVAAAISHDGLPPSDRSRASGEDPAYTEQWAGARADLVSYAELEARLRASHGSAIIFGFGDRGGHAFNAFWDRDRNSVQWADAQAGLTGDWPPQHHERVFPRIEAIEFPSKKETTDDHS